MSEAPPGGDTVLTRAVVVAIKRWLREPAIRKRHARADAQMGTNPPAETSLKGDSDRAILDLNPSLGLGRSAAP